MKHRLYRLLGILFLCAVVVSIGFWTFRSQAPFGEKVVLADGTELTLHAITYGKTNDMTYGRPWERLAARVPDGLATNWNWMRRWRAGVQKVHLAYPEDRLVLWFVGVFPTNGLMASMPGRLITPGTGAGGGFRWRLGGSFQPEIPWRIAGPEGSESGGVITPGQITSAGPWLMPVAVQSYPRRLAGSIFRIYNKPAASNTTPRTLVLAREFVLKNPKISNAPFWTPAPLPIRVEDAGVTCVLTGFEVLPPGENSSFPPEEASRLAERGRSSSFAGHGLLDRIRASFELFENGQPALRWAVQQLSILDPTGNQLTGGSTGNRYGGNTATTSFRNSSYSSAFISDGVPTQTMSSTLDGSTTFFTTQTDGQLLTTFINPLWLDEPAWKIRLKLVRTDDAADTRTFEFLAKPEWARAATPGNAPQQP